MRKIYLTCLLVLSSVLMFAQKDVTKFLGIPVDGSKYEMRKKLVAKGFTYDSQNDVLNGEFNGREVRIRIGTNNNKVWRIMVTDARPTSETDIKIHFNKLCEQFSRNKKYMSVKDYSLSEDENIFYGIKLDKKRYEAVFFQLPDKELYDAASPEEQKELWDGIENKSVWFMINELYHKFYITIFYDNEYNHSDGEDL